MSWLSASGEASAELCLGNRFAPSCRLVAGCFAAKKVFDFTLAKMKITAGLLRVNNSQTITVVISQKVRTPNVLRWSTGFPPTNGKLHGTLTAFE